MKKSTKRNLRKSIITTYKVIAVLLVIAAACLLMCLSTDSTIFEELTFLQKVLIGVGSGTFGAIGGYMINDSIDK